LVKPVQISVLLSVRRLGVFVNKGSCMSSWLVRIARGTSVAANPERSGSRIVGDGTRIRAVLGC
jgi:hypothetical protein